MPDNDKTQEQLAQEIESLRSQLTDLRLEHIKRKQAEEELWESERRFLRLLDGLPLVVFVLDAEGKPYYQNKASRELFGKDIGPEAGGHLQEAFQAYLAGTDQVYPKERSPIQRALNGESSTVEDMEIRRPDKTIPVEVYGSPIYNLQGGIKYAVGVFHDISERLRAEEALRRSEAFTRAIITHSPVGITVRDREGPLVLYNEAWMKIWTLSDEKVQENERISAGWSFEKRYPHLKAYAPNAQQLFQEGGELFIPEVETRSTDPGVAQWVSLHFYALKNAEGLVEQIVTLTEDITARKKIEESLRQSEERYRSLMDNLNVGVYRNTPGPKGKFIEANPALVKMFGYSAKEELFEINVSDLYEHPEDRTQINEKLLRDGYVRNEVLRLKKTEGTPLWGSVTAVAVRDEVGTVIYYDGIIEDVTERKRAEEALREGEKRYRAVMEQTADGIILFDSESKHALEANPAYQKLLGYLPEEFLDLTLYDICADKPENIDRIAQRIQSEKRVFLGERRHRTKDGSLADVEVSASLITYGGKEAFCVIVRDIAERKRAELALSESEEKYRTLVENVNIGIYRNTGGPQGQFVQANPAMVKIFGFDSLEDLMARPVAECYQNPEEREQFIAKIKRHGFARDEELRLRKKDGSPFWASVTAQAQFDARGEVLWTDGVIEDITERKRTEEALRETEERYKDLFENAQIGIYRTTPEGRILMANPALIKMLRYSSFEELAAINVETEGYGPEYPRNQFKDLIEKDGEIKGLEATWRRRDKTTIFVRENARVFRGVDGKALYYEGTAEDITERKQAEEVLRKSEREYRYLYEESPAFSLMIGIDGTIKDANQTTLDHLGYTKESVLGRPALEFVAPEQREKAMAQLERDFKGEPTPEIELDILAKDGSRRTILFSPGQLVLYEEDRPTSILISGTDIAERKQAEEALQKAHKELEERVQERTVELQEVTRNLEVRNQQLSRILDTGGSMLVSLNIDTLLNEIAKAVRDTLGFEIVVLNVVDEVNKEARFAAQAGLGKEARKALEGATVRMKWDDLKSLFQERFRVSRSCYFIPHGTVDWRTHAPTTGPIAQKVAVSDPLDKDPWHPEDALLALVELREKTVAGMFSLDSPRTGKRPSQETLLLLDVFTNLAAVAIDNARLYEQLQRELGERKQAQEALRQAHGELERRVEERTGELRDTLGKLRRTTETSIQAMALIVEMKDPYTAGHQRNVANLATAIAQELNLDAERTEGLRIAAMIHDVGKIGIPTEILTRPGPLSELEHHLIRDHPQLSSDILKTIDFSWPVAEIVRQHHEKMDGSGYPRGLKGDEILMEARILVVADVLESLAFHRPYRPGHGIEKALEELSSQRGKLYDGAVVDACLRLFKEKSFNFA
jgi:PAS domain S-box-containing protein